MRRKTVYQNEPIGKLTRIKDFLPPPEKLVIPQDTVKITISLSKASVDFFKRQAGLHQSKYQRMIRQLVDRYVMQYSHQNALTH
ncbi:MAG: CopG family transcriptional regulator [Omnitrophica WOR_2 bacterium RIFCSPLOWO2_12_FULL_46_30]|nr:MAG: CopG family transcriptional regulator [Omnitrophica WOR_2 bacterium RIFCSPHIGHO2_02_FULL_46_37]OGX42457.1 MAG: CopG family transcriptional regulator [Omnitrophica WOR_2 bacterium RIFCSPLOWO2_02_FULL_45_28]OGX50161.1 MAG: CopG family transcriptional regulator [Omnitrophica WOR_2 bacterium RIFCSPLOWO2_12_FULL_46_30]